MADEQLEWVFDSLVEFLRGPIWNIPVLTFIEQKSVVFEPGAENDEEMKKIHEAYKNLVDFMLGSYMEDLRITPDEFEKSCSVATKKALNQFHQSLFQQVWAADDFEIFRRMMTQKNLELQLQALEFLTQKRGSVPNCMESNDATKDEEKSMEEIIKKAIEEVREGEESEESNVSSLADTALQEKMKLEAQKEKELLEQAIKQSVQEKDPDRKSSDSASNESQNTTKEDQKDDDKEIAEDPKVDGQTPEDDRTTNDDAPEAGEPEPKPIPDEQSVPEPIPDEKYEPEPIPDEKSEPEPIPDEKSEPEPVPDEKSEPEPVPVKKPVQEGKSIVPKLPELCLHSGLPPVEQKKEIEPTLPPLRIHEERPWTEGDSNVYEKEQVAQVEVTPMEMERRQNYLRQQRDRILAMKKQERARRLSSTEEVITQSRPKSARAARKVLREESTDEVDPQTLVFRKSLAARLRCEVIDKAD